ncbi:MAG: 2-phosphosulfolactate phosphatase family protein [Pseudanabaenaceae cyanobacterium bins.68]|nr:2-phosphosulfolactate phosphatase family protein [Pseudanabaenaceae cyanobacterium bins.68]
MKLSVFHTPELVPSQGLADCAIAIDILRATTTIVTALANGAEAVQVFADLEILQQASAAHPPALTLRAAERGGAKVAGYDLGNSPFDYGAEVVAGKRIFMSTTNGTRALAQVQDCAVVLAAAMVNLGAIVQYIQAIQPETVWIVGSGWQGSYALEDTACAGAIVDALQGELINDEAYGAVALYQTWRDRLEQLFTRASHGQRLLGLDCAADLAYAAELDRFNVVPKQVAPGILKVVA